MCIRDREKKEAAQQLLVDFRAFQPENANRFVGMLCTLPEPEDEDGEQEELPFN